MKKGFTLIELLVVIAIIGMLSSVIIASLNSARSKSRDAKRVSDLKQLQNALQLYFEDNNGSYPQSSSAASIAITPANQAYINAWNAPLVPVKYISAMPNDPLNIVSQYGYYYVSGSKPNGRCGTTATNQSNNYVLATRLENPLAYSSACNTTFSGWDNASLNYIVGM